MQLTGLMKTQYHTATTLDGLPASEGDSLDWLHSPVDLDASSYPAFSTRVGADMMP
ncbi:MAG: hypothetical protein ACLGIK_15640 [Gemmatimonadota bacterium]